MVLCYRMDCYTALIHLLLIWEASSAVTQLSCNLTGAFKETRVWVGREETWVQAKFRPLMCFKTWNVLGFSFGFVGYFGFEWVFLFGSLLCLVSDCFEITFLGLLFKSYSRENTAKKTLNSLLFMIIGGVTK